MTGKTLCVAFILAILCSLGCHSSQKQIDRRLLISQENLTRITGMQWILQKMILADQKYSPAGEKPYIQFEPDGKVSGFASINRYFGSVQINEDGQIKWSPLGSTRMAGPEELMKQEDIYLKSLPMTEKMSIEGIHLYLSSNDKKTELVFYVPVE